jgi:hypothetical protein
MCNIQGTLIYGYHGTDSRNVESILENGFNSSTKPHDWMGRGIYFWQDAPERAKSWAKSYHSNPVVVCAEILIDFDHTIDLFDSSPKNPYVEWMKRSYSHFRETLSNDDEFNKQIGGFHGLDRLIVDYVADEVMPKEMNKHIQAVRSVFIEGNPLFPAYNNQEKSAFHDLSHVQIAVRDSNIIQKTYVI